MKLKKFFLMSIITLFISSCSKTKEEVFDLSQNLTKTSKEYTLKGEKNSKISWNSINLPKIKKPPLAVEGNLNLALNSPFYTLRTEGIATDFQETSAFRELLYQSLLDYDIDKNEFYPVLAKKWSYQVGQTDPIYFEVDPSARWSDGTEVTAEDVVATFNFLKQEELNQREKTDFYQTIKSYSLSKYLVCIELSGPSLGNFYRLAKQSIYPAKELALYEAKSYLSSLNDRVLMGSGAYDLDIEHSAKDKELSFIHKKNYWAQNHPYLKNFYHFQNIKLKIIPENKSQEWSFKSGLVDVLTISNSQSWLEQWISQKEPFLARGIWQKRKVFNLIPHGVSGVAFNLRKPLLNDIRLRQALFHIWDRDNMIKNLFLGESNPTNSFYPRSQYENLKNPRFEYNPLKAKEMLKNLGYSRKNQDLLLTNSQGKTLDLELLITSREISLFQQFTQEAKKIGINLKVTILPYNALQLRIINHDYDLVYSGFRGVVFPDPQKQFHSNLADSQNSLNIWGLKNEEVDKLLFNFDKKDFKEQIKIIQKIDYIVSSQILFMYSKHVPYTNRLIFWNKFDYPQNPLGSYENVFSISKYWSINPEYNKILKQKDLSKITFPVGEEISNYTSLNP